MKRQYLHPLTYSQQICNEGCLMGFSNGEGDPTQGDKDQPSSGGVLGVARRLYC